MVAIGSKDTKILTKSELEMKHIDFYLNVMVSGRSIKNSKVSDVSPKTAAVMNG